MPVPSAISDLSQTAGSNYPAGSESPNTADDYFRAHASFIAMLRDGKNYTDPVTLASASTTDIGGQNSLFVEISGTNPIASFGTNYNGPRFLRFSGALTLTHSSSLNLPGSADITTVAGDTCIAIPNSTPNGWNVVQYQKSNLSPGTISSSTTVTTQAIGDNSTKISTTEYADRYGSRIQPITASVATNAMTLTVNPTVLDFRSTTAGSGTVTTVAIPAAISTVISSGSTAGTTNAVPNTIVVAVINNAGTGEVAWCNLAGGLDISETGLISTTAEGGAGAADSASTWYSTTARSNVAYRIVGTVKSTQATAGTWATAPSAIQGVGGLVNFNKLVQIARTLTGAVASGGTVIPLDDTIPQQTEGDQFMTVSITPTNASSILEINVVAVLSEQSTADTIIGALFRDSTSNAIAAATMYKTDNGTGAVMTIQTYVTAGSTSATTFKFRAGGTGLGNVTINGSLGGRLMGGVMASSIIVKEYLP